MAPCALLALYDFFKNILKYGSSSGVYCLYSGWRIKLTPRRCSHQAWMLGQSRTNFTL